MLDIAVAILDTLQITDAGIVFVLFISDTVSCFKFSRFFAFFLWITLLFQL